MDEVLGGQHCITAGRKFDHSRHHQRTNSTAHFASGMNPDAMAVMARAVQDQPNARDFNDGYSEQGDGEAATGAPAGGLPGVAG